MSSNHHEEWNVNALPSHSTKHFYDTRSRNNHHPLYLQNQQQQQQLNHSQQLLQLQSQNQHYQHPNFHYNPLKRLRPSLTIETPNPQLPPLDILPPPPPELNTLKKIGWDPEQNLSTVTSFSILPPLNCDSVESNENKEVFTIQWNPCMQNKASKRNSTEEIEICTDTSSFPPFDDFLALSNSQVLMNTRNEQTIIESHLRPHNNLTPQLHASSASIPSRNGLQDQNDNDLHHIKENYQASVHKFSPKVQRSDTSSMNFSAENSVMLSRENQSEVRKIEDTKLFASDFNEKHESPDEEVEVWTTSLMEKGKSIVEKSFALKIRGNGHDDYTFSDSLTSLSDDNPIDESEIITLAQSAFVIPENALITREDRLRLAKEKLQHARDHLVKVLKRKRSISPIPFTVKLPSITAMRQSLIILPKSQDVKQSEFDWFPLLPEPKLMDHPCEVVIPYANFDESVADAKKDGNETKESHEELYQKGRALKKNLLLLKKKKLEITLRKQKELQKKKAFVNTCEIPTPLSKEALKKRQEELQQAVDVAYWKRLVIQQRNLLETEKLEVHQQNESIQSYQEEINSKLAAIVGCETTLRELRVRERCLEESIAKAMQDVLSARKLRYDFHQR